ncbi:MAG: zf-HC2 domain-containing protein [Acidobacteriota bacterium]
MTEHVTEQDLRNFRANRLSRDRLTSIDDHLASCEMCRGRSIATLDTASVQRFEMAIRPSDHLTYDQLEGYVDGRLSPNDSNVVRLHIGTCGECANELSAFRSLAPLTVTSRPRWFSSFRDLFVRPIPLLASSLVLIAVVGSLLLYSSERTTPVPQESAELDVFEPNVANEQVVPSDAPDAVPESIPEETSVLSINDGGEEISIGQKGDLKGYRSAPWNYRNSVKHALTTGKLVLPDLSDLSSANGVLMGDATIEAGNFRLRAPVGKVLMTNTPTFSWQALDKADRYTVEVFDPKFNKVAASGDLKATTWKTQLPRGKTYTWQVIAMVDNKVAKSPHRPDPDARFRILDRKTSDDLGKLRRMYPRSHLLLGTAFAEAGLIDEAISELEKLGKQNSNRQIAAKLLRQLRHGR